MIKYSRYFTYIEPVLKIPIVRTYGGVILAIITLTAFIIFAIKPTIETILVLQKEMTVQKETLNKITKKAEDLIQGEKNYQTIDPSLKRKVQIAIPSSIEMGILVKSLEAVASQSQASISALQFQPVEIGAQAKSGGDLKLAEILFTYNIDGSFETLKLVLQNLKESARLVSIDNLTFNKAEGTSSLLMSVSGKGYYLK